MNKFQQVWGQDLGRVQLGLQLGSKEWGSHETYHMGTPPVSKQIDRQTDATENNTFPQTTYAGNKNSDLSVRQHVPVAAARKDWLLHRLSSRNSTTELRSSFSHQKTCLIVAGKKL